jgi:hypothetical protein
VSDEVGATPSPQVPVTPRFLEWAKAANEAYERRRAEYRAAHPIRDLEALWKPRTARELSDYLRRRPTGRHKL